MLRLSTEGKETVIQAIERHLEETKDVPIKGDEWCMGLGWSVIAALEESGDYVRYPDAPPTWRDFA